MAALSGLTKTTDITVAARDVDFVTRFNDNWDALRAILGVMRPIRKAPGTKLTSYKAALKTTMASGSVAEGDVIPFTEFTVAPVSYSDIAIEKYAKSVSIEAVAKYGAAVAVQKTDDQFLVELQNNVLNKFYTFLNTGALVGTQKTWQRALAIAKGAVLKKFASMNKTVTEVVGFANIMDLYDYLGDAQITVQSAFGLNYVKDFMGYSTLFLLDDTKIAQKKVIAVPVENIDLYYIDPSDSDFAQLGLNFTVAGETNLIGFHSEGDYTRATGNSFALMGMALWAEYLDGIAVVTVGSTNTEPAVASST